MSRTAPGLAGKSKRCPAAEPCLPAERLERVDAWGMAASAMSHVYRPSSAEGVREAFRAAREHGARIGLRGAGRSYGDAALSSEGICLDLTRMDRILAWDAQHGVIKVEPGVSFGRLWQYILGDGYWPYVVPGTMFPTLGGCAAMNVHGKNNFRAGTVGDHVREFEILLPSGDIRRCSREENADLFFAAIGGFGMLGCFLSLTLEVKRVYSGLLDVEAIPTANLAEMIRVFEERLSSADYLVGWLDCFARGRSIGRGLVHQANYLAPGEDPEPAQTLRVEYQDLPDTFMGVLPKSMMWRFMRPFARFDRLGMRFVNWAKYEAGRLHGAHAFRQAHAAFAFLLDYVPNWKWAYKPGGLIQYQSFIPAAAAEAVFAEQLSLCQRRGIVPLLGVYKRHRPDPFWMTHGLDGYSLALDFKVTGANRGPLWALASELDRVVGEAGGRFYFAKDLTLTPRSLEGYLQEERVRRFLALKQQVDPDSLLQTDLYRRLFGRA